MRVVLASVTSLLLLSLCSSLEASASLPTLTSPFFLETVPLQGSYGSMAYDVNHGYYMFENYTISDTTVWTVADKSSNIGCYWYTPQPNSPCYCEKLASQQYPSVFWSATSLNGTYAGAQCYNGNWPVLNIHLIDTICFPVNSKIPTYLSINNGGEEFYLQVAKFSTPSASYFQLRQGCSV